MGRKMIQANGDNNILIASAGDFNIEASDDKIAINIVAYNGGKLFLSNFAYPVVMDIGGMKAADSVPFLIDHSREIDAILGQGSITKTEKQILATGFVTSTGARAKEIIANSKNGHLYQASIGARPMNPKLIDEGKTLKANGQEFEGPVVYVPKSELVEISVVAIGADRDGTRFDVAASLKEVCNVNCGDSQGFLREEKDMNFKEWLKATLGLTEEAYSALGDTEQSKIKAHYESTLSKDGDESKSEDKVIKAASSLEEIQAQLDENAEEMRVLKIEAACGSEFTELKDKAIEGGWKLEQVEAAIAQVSKIRDSRPSAPGVLVRGEKADAKVIEAGLAMAYTGMTSEKLEASYGEQVLDRADKMRNMTLKEVMAACCNIEGISTPYIGATPHDWAKAAYSTRTFPDVLSNLANKMLMEGFTRRESVATQVTKKVSAKDFKTHTKVKAIAGGGMKKVENGGPITDGTIEDAKYTYSIDTYAELLGLTRQDIINDDLGAFTDLPNQMGFDAWQIREELFFTLLLANTDSFYSTGNGNYQEGAATALSIDSLDDAVELFEALTDEKGRAIGVQPEIMLVPSALKHTAKRLYSSDLVVTGEDDTLPNKNIHQGMYKPLSSPFLSNSGITGYSSTGWYLFANPQALPAYVMAYLNGREEPYVEEVDPDPRYLGRVFRAYYDVGVAQAIKEASVFSKGSA